MCNNFFHSKDNRLRLSNGACINRERPQTGAPANIMDELEAMDKRSSHPSTLPETEIELDNLTEFNTAHNRRITMLGIAPNDDKKGKTRRIRITFNEEEEVINPEDVDPNIGRFRNMVETTVIPRKRPNSQAQQPGLLSSASVLPVKRPHLSQPGGSSMHHHHQQQAKFGLYDGLDSQSSMFSSSKMMLPNPAPDIDMSEPELPVPSVPSSMDHPQPVQFTAEMEDPDEPKKKKYAKEAWPGRKPGPALL